MEQLNNIDEEIEYGLEINEIEKTYRGKTATFIGMVDALGTKTGEYTWLEWISKLIDFGGVNLRMFDGYVSRNLREHHIEEMISSNISLKDMKKIQNQSLGMLKKKTILEDDQNFYLRNLIQTDDEVSILYSCGFQGLDLRREFPSINKAELEQRKRNLDLILSLNPDADIYQFGCPSFKKNDTLNAFLQEENERIQKLAFDFGTCYVDLSGFECLRKNRKLQIVKSDERRIALECIKAIYKRRVSTVKDKDEQEEFTGELPEGPWYFNNDGVSYLEEESIRRIETLGKLLPYSEEYPYLLREFEEEKNLQKIYRKVQNK